MLSVRLVWKRPVYSVLQLCFAPEPQMPNFSSACQRVHKSRFFTVRWKKLTIIQNSRGGGSVLTVGWDFKGGDPRYVACVFVVDMFACSRVKPCAAWGFLPSRFTSRCISVIRAWKNRQQFWSPSPESGWNVKQLHSVTRSKVIYQLLWAELSSHGEISVALPTVYMLYLHKLHRRLTRCGLHYR